MSNVTIVGAGVLGTALGRLLKDAGYRIVAVCSRHKRSAQVAAETIGQGEVVGDPGLSVMGADIVLLCVPDRAIPTVALRVAAGGALKRGAVVAHVAGGLPSRVLAGVAAAGAHRGSIHPLQTFADVETALRILPDSFYFLEGDREAVEVLRGMVLALEGRPVAIDSRQKAVYHAGASAASNFLVALLDYARALLVMAGIPADVALPALLPLVRGTLASLESVGLPQALTGPIARGDVGTVRSHIRGLARLPGDTLRLYRELGRRTVQVALDKGSLEPAQAQEVLAALAEGEMGLGGLPPASPPDEEGSPPSRLPP